MADGSGNGVVTESSLIGLEHRVNHLGKWGTVRLAVVLIPRFSMLSLSALVESAAYANQISGKKLFDWSFFTSSGLSVRSHCGINLEARAIDELRTTVPDLVVVIGDSLGAGFRCERIEAVLRQLRCHGARIGAIGSACFLLANAGLLRDRRCAVPWNFREAYVESFPGHEVSDDLYIVDGGIVTCAGPTAVLDLMLKVIDHSFGNRLATAIADEFMCGPVRAGDEGQPYRLIRGIKNPIVIELARLIEESIEPLVSPRELARRLQVSQRQMERLFIRHLGTSPSRYQMRVRLTRAQRMLRHTTLTVSEVAISCGFQSFSHFSKVYRQAFGLSPRQDRSVV